MLLREELKSFLILGLSPKWGGGGSALPVEPLLAVKRRIVIIKPHRIYADLENISGYPKRICTYLPKTAYAKSAWPALVSVLHFLNLVFKSLFLALKIRFQRK